MKKLSFLIASLAIVSISASAQAYVGPGAGLSLLGALWALLVAILAAVGFIFAWPIRKWLRKRKARRTAAGNTNGETQPRQGA
jgi:membrane protein implicated in regulation of membrane protease activity